MKDKYTLTKKQAREALLKNKDGMVHTFLNASFGLIGCDHELKSVHKDIDKAYAVKVAGEKAISMGHGIVIIPKKECNQDDLLFVETKNKFNNKWKKVST